MQRIQLHEKCSCPNCIMVTSFTNDINIITHHDRPINRQYTDNPRSSSQFRSSPYPPTKAQQVQFGRRTSPSSSVWDITEQGPSGVWDVPTIDPRQIHISTRVTPTPLSARELNMEILRIAKHIKALGPTATKIIPGLPTTYAPRKRDNAKRALHLHQRAKAIVEDALKGNNDYGNAHREFAVLRTYCEHDTSQYSYSSDCPSCDIVEAELRQLANDHFRGPRPQF